MKDILVAIFTFICVIVGFSYIDYGNFREYNTHKDYEFIISKKIDKAPAYKYSGELAFICVDKNNINNYIPVSNITYYNYNVGDKVIFNLSKVELDMYNGKKDTMAIIDFFLTILVIFGMSWTIIPLVAFKDKISKYEKIIFRISLIYGILSILYYLYVKIMI